MWIALLVPLASADDLGGYAEFRASYQTGVDGVPWQLVQRLRPEVEFALGERTSIGVATETSLVEGRYLQGEFQKAIDASDLSAIFDPAGCAWPADPANGVLHINRLADYSFVDRLYIDLYQPKFDLRVGRQALQWGSALLIHPVDPFPQILVNTPWLPRTGINAARLTVPFGRHQLQAVVASNDAFTRGRAGGKLTLNALETDFTLVGMYRGDNEELVVGGDIRGTAVVGFWVEGAYHQKPDTAAGDSASYADVAAGVDYSFPVLDNFVVSAQYYHNTGGSRDPEDYAGNSRLGGQFQLPTCEDDETQAAFTAPPADPFAPFTQAKNYAMAQVTLVASQEVSFNVVDIQNIDDGSGFVVPVVTTKPTGALEVSAMAQIPYQVGDARTSEFLPSLPDQTIRQNTPFGDAVADLSGLVPSATFTVWTRLNF